MWLARHYNIPFSAIETAVNRDAKWIVTRVRQTDAAVASRLFTPERVLADYDRLPQRERRLRIVAQLEVLARTARD